MSGKIYAFTPILRLKDEAEFTCHADVIKHMLQKPILSGRIGKWAYALVEYDLPNESLGAVRGQIVADFIVEHRINDEHDLEVGYITCTP